ncbi:MAG: ATP-binding protein [Anaerolineales bacterium]|nr:ATP-binding protein [Anaerolineales bacterium]
MPKSDLVLLALDNPDILPLFERALAAASYQVAIARDRAALDKILQETSPALLIISDVFKEGSGIDISAALLERMPTLPILLFVTHELPSTTKAALRVGISDTLNPPLRIDDIMRSVENSLKRAQCIGDWTRREVKRTTASLEKRVNELQKLETIFNHIEDGVIILGKDHRILLLNPAVRKAFALGQSDIAGKNILDVIEHPALDSLLNSASANLHQYHEIGFEDGRVFNAQCAPIPDIGLAITMQEITYLKRIDQMKSDFVHAVSHDLRSPLTAILGYVELLDRVGPLNDQQREFVRRVRVSVHNITALVNDLLDLGRIEGGFGGQKEIVRLDGILNYTLDNLNNQILGKKQHIHVELPPNIPSLRGDPIHLRQMLDNLIGNSIKYTPDGGEIQVRVEVNEGQVILRVSDSGPGIPPADQPHIFEKFYRASNVVDNVQGSGLGLAIVKSIVDNYEGRIWVDSVLGHGATFTVVLPAYRPEVMETRPA